jgi:hypothetical protein
VYLNSSHRSLKNQRDGNHLGALLDASETLPRLLDFLFAVEGRVKPYNKFLEWELREHPLRDEGEGLSPGELLEHIEAVATRGNKSSQLALLKVVAELARRNGHQDLIASWSHHYGFQLLARES